MKARTAIIVLVLVAAACSDLESASTTSSTTTSDATTTAATTSTAEATTTVVDTTTTTAALTTTTAALTTTTVAGDTTTTVPADTTTTTRVDVGATTTTTTPPPDADPDLLPWAGLFRQPTAYGGFLEFAANGVIRAGTAVDDLPIVGTWDYDAALDQFVFTDFDFGTGCNGAEGRYDRDAAHGGGRRITLVTDPCLDRVAFITQPGAACQCFVYLEVEQVDG